MTDNKHDTTNKEDEKSSKTTQEEEEQQQQQKRSESDVYDRQIRLWGADAQAKMSKAKVLYIHMTGATSEILKNLVLAGIRPAVCDIRNVEESKEFLQQTPSFFWAGKLNNNNKDNSNNNTGEEENSPDSEPNRKKNKMGGTIAELVQPAIEELNPLLGKCELVSCAVSELTEAMLQPFSIVVASHITPTQAMELASKLKSAQQQQTLFWVDSFGWHGSCWVDFLNPNRIYRPEKGKELLEPQTLTPYIPLKEMYQVPLHLAVNRFHKVTPPTSLTYHKTILAYLDHRGQAAWPDALDATDLGNFVRSKWLPETSPTLLDHKLFSESALIQLANQATCEMIPVCSVLGGMVGNEIIKAISGKGTPANNTILFDGTTCKGWYFLMQEQQQPKKN